MEEGASMQMADFNKKMYLMFHAEARRRGAIGRASASATRLRVFLRVSAPPREPIADLSLRRVANDAARNHRHLDCRRESRY